MSDSIFDRMVTDADEAIDPTSHLIASPDSDLVAADRTAADVKRAAQELLRHGFLEESHKRDLFRLTTIHQREIAATLEPLDLDLRIDEHRGVAFLLVARSAYESQDDAGVWAHPLVRRQRLTLEQSLLVAMLRQAFVIHEQESGIGECDAKIAVDDLLSQFAAYFGDSGSDAKNESRLLILLDQLKPYGIVSEADKNQEIVIRPLIAHLANPDSLSALLALFAAKSHNAEPTEHDT